MLTFVVLRVTRVSILSRVTRIRDVQQRVVSCCFFFSSFTFQASTASDRITAPRRHAETGPSVVRSRTATCASAHLASPGRIARTTSTSATGTRADTVPARTFTDLTSKSNGRRGRAFNAVAPRPHYCAYSL